MSAPLAELPALPLHEAGKYVAAAYIVLFVVLLIYVAIMAIRLSRIERELGELLELAERSGDSAAAGPRREASAAREPAAQPGAGAGARREGAPERDAAPGSASA